MVLVYCRRYFSKQRSPLRVFVVFVDVFFQVLVLATARIRTLRTLVPVPSHASNLLLFSHFSLSLGIAVSFCFLLLPLRVAITLTPRVFLHRVLRLRRDRVHLLLGFS